MRFGRPQSVEQDGFAALELEELGGAMGAVAALLDDLNRFGRGRRHHGTFRSMVKALVAIATGRVSSSSVAMARTKATVRVT